MGSSTSSDLYALYAKKLKTNPELGQDRLIEESLQEYDMAAIVPGGHPTGQQLQQVLSDYMPTLQAMYPNYNAPPMTPEVMQQRYEYSEKCRKVLMKIIAEKAQRHKLFSDTAERLFKKDFGDAVHRRVDERRWIENLIKIGDTDEIRYHNEEVVALTMLCESKAHGDLVNGKKLFRETRYQHYINNLKLSENDAAQRADHDLEVGIQRLMDLALEQIKQDCSPLEVADEARDAIITGTADNMPGGLEAAYRKIDNPGEAMAWNIQNITDDFRDFGLSISADEYRRTFRPIEMNSTTTHKSIVQQVANPFYAILDPVSLINAGVITLLPRSGETIETSAVASFGYDMTSGYLAAQMDAVRKELPRFALEPANERGIRGLAFGITVFSNNRGRTVIVTSDSFRIENGLRIPTHTDAPGKLLNQDFTAKMADLRQKSVAHDRFMHSSGKYRSMKRALNALADMDIPDQLNVKQAKKLEKKINALKKATDAYLKRKDDQFKERGTTEGKDNYEKARYAFAKEMKSYIDDLSERAKLVREHTETMERVVRAERAEAQRMAAGPMDLPFPELTPFQRSVKDEDDRFAAEQHRIEEQKRLAQEKIDREKKEREQKEADMLADEGDRLGAALADAEKNIAHENKDVPTEAPAEMGAAMKSATERAEQAFQNALDAGNQEQIKACGENLLATKAVWEMIKAGYGLTMDLGARLQNIAEGGQLDTLVAGMKLNSKFKERLPMTDMSNRAAFERTASTSARISGRHAVSSLKESKKRTFRIKNDEKRLSNVKQNQNGKDGPQRIG